MHGIEKKRLAKPSWGDWDLLEICFVLIINIFSASFISYSIVILFSGSSNANPPFWIPIHIVIPERPTECAVFNVVAGTRHDLLRLLTLFIGLGIVISNDYFV